MGISCDAGEVIETCGPTKCLSCKCDLKSTDGKVHVNKNGVQHVRCPCQTAILDDSREVPAADPQGPAKRKAAAKQEKHVRKGNTKMSFDGDEAKATKRHEHLMEISKALQRKGEAKGEKYKARHEPIKKSSWCDTRHQVVFRWLTSGKCKTTGFDYDETSYDDELFKACLGKTLDIAVDSAMKSA